MGRWSFAVRLVVGFVVGLAVVEVVARQLEPALDEPLVWHDFDTERKAEVMAATTTPVRVLAGTSQVAQGVDPALFGEPTLNVALSSGAPQLMERWLLDDVDAMVEIDQVVWGVTPLIDFSATDPQPSYDRYLEAFATRPGMGAEVLRWLAEHSSMVRARPAWAGSGWYRGLVANEPRRRSTNNELGYRTEFRQTVRDTERQRWIDGLADHAFGGEQLASFNRTVSELESRGIDVIVVEMPVAERLIELTPGGSAAHDRFRSEMVREIERSGVTFVPADDRWFENSNFLDFTHFSAEAAQEFTAELVAQIE